MTRGTPEGASDPDSRERSRAYTQRPRRIPPELAQDFGLEMGCSLLAALLLYRLITFADDQGRLPADPRYLRSVCFGMRDEVTVKKVATALDELTQSSFVIVYQAAAKTYLQIVDWWSYQGQWGRRAYPSRYPAPPGWTQDRTFGLGGSTGHSAATDAPTGGEQDAHQLLTDSERTAPPYPSPSTDTNTDTATNTYTPLGSPPLRDGDHDAPPARTNGRNPTRAAEILAAGGLPADIERRIREEHGITKGDQ